MSHVNTTRSSLSIATDLVSEMANLFAADLAEARGESGLKMVEEITAGLTLVADAVSIQLATAGARATTLRAEVQDEALARIVTLLNCGSITLADITSRLSGFVVEPPAAEVSTVVAAVALELPAVAVAVAAPATETAIVAAATLAGVPVPTQRLTAPYKSAVKFFDPVSGAGWSGRGPMPKWFSDLLVNGKTKEDFRVVAQAAEIPAAPPEVPAAAQVQPLVGAVDVAAGAEVAAPVAATDIGADVSFDANFDFDEVTAPAKRDDDIGEFITEFASMNVAPPVAQLMAA